jgi:hypothetical protein
MEEHFHKLPPRLVAFLLGLAGTLLSVALVSFFVGPTSPAGAQDFRSMQVWPDRSIGVSSAYLAGSTSPPDAQVFPLGAYRTAEGDVVRARTYLHFPLDVFPPGTDIRRATLHMYVDSGSGAGGATLGVYRALEPWGDMDVGWGSDPAAWPALLTLPLATRTVRFDVTTPTVSVSSVVLTSILSPLATPTLAPSATPTAASTPTPSTSPLPTPTPSPTPAAHTPVVTLGQVAETWIVWDVTALMRAWLAGEVPDDGIVLASVADAAGSDTLDDLLVARWLAADDLNTRPYIVAEFDVLPVTPTYPPSPLSTPAPVLPPAGSPGGSGAVGLLLAGGAFLVLGLAVWRRSLARAE